MPWDVDIDYLYNTRSEAVSRINSLTNEGNWQHIGVFAKVDGTFSVDSDWEFTAIQDALNRIGAQAQIPGFVGASLKLA